MMKNTLFLLVACSLIYGCSGDSKDINITQNKKLTDTIIDSFEERVAEIEKYSTLLYEDSLKFNVVYAKALLNAYEVYIRYHSFEAISKDYQFKAGELAKSLHQPHKAIKHFNDLLERDPEHKKAPVALFYKAMVIGDMLHEDELAKATYQEFIDQYPNHSFVESARQSIKLQGKSLEEIVAGFEKNS